MRLDQRYFERVAAKQHNDCVLESYRAVHARSTMLLFSRTTRTPLAALTLKSKDLGCLSMVTGRPSPARNPDQPYFQGMLNLPGSDFTFVITNLSGEGMVNFNVLHAPHRVWKADSGPSYGINEVNELHVGQSYEIQADQRTGRGMVLKGKTVEVKADPATREREAVPLTVEGSEATKDKSKEGLYFYLSVVPDASSKSLVSKFAEGTAWRAAPGFVRRVAAPPAAPCFYRHSRGGRHTMEGPWSLDMGGQVQQSGGRTLQNGSSANNNNPPSRSSMMPPPPSSTPNEPADAVASVGNASDSLSKPKPDAKARHKRQRLLLLRHAAKCTAEVGQCTVNRHCAEMKALWKHMANCKDSYCKVRHCMSSQYVLGHYRRCKPPCNICDPVKEIIKNGFNNHIEVDPAIMAGGNTQSSSEGGGMGGGRQGGMAQKTPPPPSTSMQPEQPPNKRQRRDPPPRNVPINVPPLSSVIPAGGPPTSGARPPQVPFMGAVTDGEDELMARFDRGRRGRRGGRRSTVGARSFTNDRSLPSLPDDAFDDASARQLLASVGGTAASSFVGAAAVELEEEEALDYSLGVYMDIDRCYVPQTLTSRIAGTEEAECAPVQRPTPRESPSRTAALLTREAFASDPARSTTLAEEMAAPALSAKRSLIPPSFTSSFPPMSARSHSGCGFGPTARSRSARSHRAELMPNNSSVGAGAGNFGSTPSILERGSRGVDRMHSLRPHRSGSSSSSRSISMSGPPTPRGLSPLLLDNVADAAIHDVMWIASDSDLDIEHLIADTGREVSHRGDSPARHCPAAPVEVGSTQAGELDYSDRVHVRSGYTGHEYAYERASEPTVLCLSIWEGMKFLPLLDSAEAMLEAEVQEWVKNEGKALIASLNAVYREEKCVIDLESEADTILCTCGHQCINHTNVTNDLRRCPICRSPVTSFVRADGIVV